MNGGIISETKLVSLYMDRSVAYYHALLILFGHICGLLPLSLLASNVLEEFHGPEVKLDKNLPVVRQLYQRMGFNH